MTKPAIRDDFDLYVWEGLSDIAARAERCLAGMDVTVVRADAGTAFPPPRDVTRTAVALVSVSVMGDKRFSGYDWLASQGMPVRLGERPVGKEWVSRCHSPGSPVH